jgi:hypothetical protein
MHCFDTYKKNNFRGVIFKWNRAIVFLLIAFIDKIDPKSEEYSEGVDDRIYAFLGIMISTYFPRNPGVIH